MFSLALDSFIHCVSNILNFLNSFKIYGDISYLEVIVGFCVLLLIIDNFVLKGQ